MSRGHLMQTSFAGGEWSPRLDARVDLIQGTNYHAACKKLENFFVWPHGPAQNRSGLKFIKAAKNASKTSRLIPFRYSSSVSYMLEFGEYYIRFYKDRAQLGAPYEVTTPYAEADLADLKFKQSADVLYIAHPSHAPRKLSRLGDTTWTLEAINFNMPPTAEISSSPAADLTFSATSGLSILVTASAGIFQSGDTFRRIREKTTGTGLATIIGFISTTQVICEVIDTFSGVAISSGGWTLEGSPYAKLTPSAASPLRQRVTLTSGDATTVEVWVNATTWLEHLLGTGEFYLSSPPGSKPSAVYLNGLAVAEATLGALAANQWDWGIPKAVKISDGASNWWVQSPTYPNLFYLDNGSGVKPATKPAAVWFNTTLGTDTGWGPPIPSSHGEWAWGDKDTLGYSTIYVFVDAGAVDPDSKADGYMGYGVENSIIVRLLDDTDPDSKTAGYTNYVASKQAGQCFRSGDVGKYVYLDDGIVKITQYITTLLVSGQIVKALSATTQTLAWTMESPIWSAALGYPGAVAFYQDRLGWGGSASYPDTVGLSVTGDYENHSRGSNADDAILFTLNSREINQIKWLISKDVLFIGTVGAEYKVGEKNVVLTPSNINAPEQSDFGSEGIEPVSIGSFFFFLQTGGRHIRKVHYDFDTDSYLAPDVTILAEHITQGGISQMAVQMRPFSTIWCVRADGVLAALTYMEEEGVNAWHRHITDGIVESVACIPGTGYDEVWVIVKRTINGVTKRYIEVLEKPFDLDNDQGTSSVNAFIVDSGITYSGVATKTITGLNHLTGETVKVLADGAVHADCLVQGGQITLSRNATVVHAGLAYVADLLPMRFEGAASGGRAQGRTKRAQKLALRLYKTMNCKYGPDSGNLDSVDFRGSSTPMGQPEPLFSGDKTGLDWPGGYETDGYVYIRQDSPLPIMVQAVMPEMEVS